MRHYFRSYPHNGIFTLQHSDDMQNNCMLRGIFFFDIWPCSGCLANLCKWKKDFGISDYNTNSSNFWSLPPSNHCQIREGLCCACFLKGKLMFSHFISMLVSSDSSGLQFTSYLISLVIWNLTGATYLKKIQCPRGLQDEYSRHKINYKNYANQVWWLVSVIPTLGRMR